ncbi:MAG: hypothetical protein AAGU74_10905 [Bacillota bacterium]
MKKVAVLIGNFGSGKTEIALNLVFEGVKRHKAVLVDLDVINPYFRSAERKRELTAAGIKLLHPNFSLTTVDVPSLPPEIRSVFQDDHELVVFDVGGDPAGATVLGQYKSDFDALPEGSLEVLFVINPFRPFSAEPQMVTDLYERIRYRARLAVTGLVNNANLSVLASAEDLIKGYDIVKSVSERLNIPVRYTCGRAQPLRAFLQMARERKLEEKYIGEPFEINTYMHRDWDSFTEKGI